MKTIDFIGKNVIYDRDGQVILGNKDNGHQQMIADVRGWGAIQNLFKNPNGTIREDEAIKLQDNLGQYIADAINEKMERDRNPRMSPLLPNNQ